MGEQIKKTWYIYTIKFYEIIKENEIILFAGKWLELEIISVNEMTQTQKDKYQMFALMWNLGGWEQRGCERKSSGYGKVRGGGKKGK